MTRGANKRGGKRRNRVMDDITKQMTKMHAYTISLDIFQLATFRYMYKFSLSEKIIYFFSHCFYSFILSLFLSLLLLPSPLHSFLSFIPLITLSPYLLSITFFSHSFQCLPHHSSTSFFLLFTLKQLGSFDK
jgi:hypothetical protein